jgi:hypothetical protein
VDFYYEKANLCLFVDDPPHDREDASKADDRKRNRVLGMGF